MINWHRKIWRLDPIEDGSLITELFDSELANTFWLEPFVAAGDNVLGFRVEFSAGNMVKNWEGVTLAPKGNEDFESVDTINESTERLEGTIGVGPAVFPLQLFINKAVSTKKLTILVGESEEDGEGGGTGIATGQTS